MISLGPAIVTSEVLRKGHASIARRGKFMRHGLPDVVSVPGGSWRVVQCQSGLNVGSLNSNVVLPLLMFAKRSLTVFG